VFLHYHYKPIRLLNGSRWVRELNNKAFERTQQHFQAINVDRVAREEHAHVIADRIHDLVVQKFKDQQDLRPRHQVGEMLDSETADD